MKRWRYLLIILLLIAGALLLIGCAKTVYVPVETVKTEFRNINTTDSIHIKDSVFVLVKGDTVYNTRVRVEYRDRFKTDSIVIRDSIPVPYGVPEYVEKKLSRWQWFRIRLGGIALGLVGGGFFWFVVKRRIRGKFI